MTDVPDGLPSGQRFLAILTIALSIAMAVLDSAIANVALPTIARDLQAAPADSIWVVNAYQLAVTIALLPLASLGDIYGYRRIYKIGLAVFTVASLCCALSDSLLTLTLARVVQGFGAAGIMSVNTALVRFIYPRAMLGRGMGINALVVATSSAIGPSLASVILALGDWPWLFAINVPIGLVAQIIALRSLPATPRASHQFDIVSAVLNACTFGLLLAGVDGISHGQQRGAVAVCLVVALVAGVLLVRRQLSLASPLLPVDLLRIPLFRLSVLTSICSFAAQSMAFVSMPFYFQNALGLSQVQTGLYMTPWPATLALIAPLSGRLADRFSSGVLGGIGLALLCVGLLATAYLPDVPGSTGLAWAISWRMALCGIGFGLFQAPNNRAMIGAAPPHRSGGASGMLSTARLLGQTGGAALVALIFGLVARHSGADCVLAGAAFAAFGTVISLLRLTTPAHPAEAGTGGGGVR